MTNERRILCHYLATLAYRTQKALRGAPSAFGCFRAAEGVRSPAEVVHHMTGVISFACGCFGRVGDLPACPGTLPEEIARFHGVLQELGNVLESGTPLLDGVTLDQLLQGPLSDAMTHAGQLAMLRRLAGSPVPPESFIEAGIRASRLGSAQALPVTTLDEERRK